MRGNRPQSRGSPEGAAPDRSGIPGRAAAAALVIGLTAGGIAVAPAAAEDSAALRAAAGAMPARPGALPEPPGILGEGDVARYRRIFALQEDGRWPEAKRLIAQLEDRLLMGHVLAQRYLHPTKYRSRYSELARWLERYADHPQARRIYRLALRRKPRSAAGPTPPRSAWDPVRAKEAGSAAGRPKARRTVSRAERRLMAQVRRYVRREYLSIAGRYVDKRAGALGPAATDRARAVIAGGWFRWGEPQRAYDLAAAAAGRSGAAAPGAHWWAGLAAYKLARFGEAARHFEDAARAAAGRPNGFSRAAFWAARAHLVGGRPDRVNDWLRRAAGHPRTFYGMIAARLLGSGPRFALRPGTVTPTELRSLLRIAPVRRALALGETGEYLRAERELAPLLKGGGADHLRSLAALADAARLAGTAIRAAKALRRLSGERLDGALYPLPQWSPEGGFSIDRALVFALARQESEFNARARSRSGARGLLQLMPSTARYMSGSRRHFRGRHRARLYDPGINLALGQRYVDYLLTGEVASGNMILTIAAYNGGPGNMEKWHRKGVHGDDPLVFIEAIPLRETRLFVQRVLENLWVYRMRLGQETPSLTALAEGRWPLYVGLDGARLGVAEERSPTNP